MSAPSTDIVPNGRQQSLQGYDRIVISRPGEDYDRLAVGENKGDLIRVETEIDREQDGSEQCDGTDQIDHLERILREYANAIAGPRTETRKPSRQPLNASQVVRMRYALSFKYEGSVAGEKLRVAAIYIAKCEVS